MTKARIDSKALNSKWITPETEKKISQAARATARVAFWDTDTALLRFGGPVVAFVIIFLLSQKVGAWPLIIASLVSIAGIIIIARIRGRLTLRHIYNEELSKRPDEWKNYYEILRMSPAAGSKAITEAHDRLLHLFNEVLSENTKSIGVYSIDDINEAFNVLSDRFRRAAYDRVFWMRTNMQGMQLGETGRPEIVATMQSIADVMDTRSSEGKPAAWQMPAWGRGSGQAALAGVMGILPVVAGGTSLAFAKPDNNMAVPFKGIAASIAKVSAGAVDLIVDIRSIAASQERSVVATAFQSMRIDANLVSVAPLPESTNDMARFPSTVHPLYPEYLETRFSQFRYNVDEYGVVTVDASWATTTAMLESLNELLAKLEAGD